MSNERQFDETIRVNRRWIKKGKGQTEQISGDLAELQETLDVLLESAPPKKKDDESA